MEFGAARKRGRPQASLNGNGGYKKSKQEKESFPTAGGEGEFHGSLEEQIQQLHASLLAFQEEVRGRFDSMEQSIAPMVSQIRDLWTYFRPPPADDDDDA